MKALISFLLLFCQLAVYSQKKPAVSRYYVFTGTIDKYPVTFHLHRTNEHFTGSYYYHSSQEPIAISGVVDNSGFLKLTHWNMGDQEEEKLEGSFKDSLYSGNWQYKGKMLSFRIAQKKDSSGLSFDYIWTYGTKKFDKKEDYDPDSLEYEGAAIWPVANTQHPATNIIKQVVRESFGDKNSNDDIGKILLRQKNEILNPKSSKEDDFVSFFEDDKVEIFFQSNKLLAIGTISASYSGGAHGYYGTSFENIDLQNLRRIELKDVLDSASAASTIQKILEKKVLARYNIEKLEDALLVGKIEITDNILLTEKGIAFNYRPYQIAAYALGEIFLYIPYKEILPVLKPAFKKWMGL
jgi:hypothetical protein